MLQNPISSLEKNPVIQVLFSTIVSQLRVMSSLKDGIVHNLGGGVGSKIVEICFST